MVFDYYKRLSPARQSVYRQSDAIQFVQLPDPVPLRPAAVEVEAALKQEKPRAVEALSQRIADGITDQLKAPRLRVQVGPDGEPRIEMLDAVGRIVKREN